MVTREEFLQLKNVVQEIRSEMRKFQVDVLQRFAKLEDQLDVTSFLPAILATSEPTLTCVQCGSDYTESLNAENICSHHSGCVSLNDQYSCCKMVCYSTGHTPGCKTARHRSKHHIDYPYESYIVYMEKQCASAKEVWMEMDLTDPFQMSCLWSEVGLAENDSLYILVGSDKNTPTAIFDYTMKQLTQCESSCYIALDKTGSTGWNLKVELQSSNSIATSIIISMSFSPHTLMTKRVELLYEGGAFRPGHVTCLTNPHEIVDPTLPGYNFNFGCAYTQILPGTIYEGHQLEVIDYSKGRKNDYQCVTNGCPVVLRQYGHTCASSTRKLANGRWNNLFTVVLGVTNQSSIGMAAREVFGEHLSKDGSTWVRCEQIFLAKEVLLDGGRRQEWLDTADFFIEPNSTASWKVILAIQFDDNPPDHSNARKAHPSLPQPLHLRVTLVDHDKRASSLRLEQGNPPLIIPTRQSREKQLNAGKPLLFYLFADDITTLDRCDVSLHYNEKGVLSFTTSDSVFGYTTRYLYASELLQYAARAKQTRKEETVLENTCFENSTASVKGYLVTDLDFGVPCAIKVFIKTQTSSSTGYYTLPHKYFDIESPTLCVEPHKILVGEELTVKWVLNRVSHKDKIVISSPHGKSSIVYAYNTKAETIGVVKMKAPDAVGVYQLRYYPGWLNSWNTMYRHSQCVAVATFETTALWIR